MSTVFVRFGLITLIASVTASSRVARADDWAGHGMDAARTRLSAEVSGATFADGHWNLALPRRVTIVSSAAVADDRVVFGAFDGVVRALRASDGTPSWEHKVGDGIYATPVIDRGRVFVPSSDKKLHALRLADGATIWTRDLGGIALGTPSVVGGALIVAAGFPQRTIMKIDAASGETVWQTPVDALAQFSNSAPAIAGDRVVVGASGGHYYAFDLATGALVWTYEADGVVNLSAPLVVGARAYMLPGGASRRMHGVDLETGRALPGWPVTLPFSLPDVGGQVVAQQLSVSSLTAAGGRVVADVRTDDSMDTDGDKVADRHLLREYVLAVDLATAEVAWQRPNGRALVTDPNEIPKFWLCPAPFTYPTVDGQLLIGAASTLTPSLTIFDAATGAEQWATQAAAPSLGSPLLANGRLIVTTRAGVEGFLSSTNHPPGVPTFNQPPDGRLNAAAPKVSWSPSYDADGDAVSYTVRVDRDGEVLETWESEAAAGLDQTSIRLPGALEAGATYAVAIRARDSRGALSPWSAPIWLTAVTPPPLLVDGKPQGSLAEAVATASAGSVIDVGPGVTRLVDTLTLPQGVVIRGAGPGATVLDGGGLGVGLRLQGGPGGKRTRVSGLTIQHAPVGIAVQQATDAEISNVILGDAETGLDVAANATVDLVNGTLIRNGTAVRSAGLVRVRNSIVAYNRTAFWAAEQGMLVSRYNDLFDNMSDNHNTPLGVGDLSSAVVFADAARDDFHLVGPQASTDHGDPVDGVGDEPAPHGDRVNLGAFGGTAEAEQSAAPSVGVTAGAKAGSPMATPAPGPGQPQGGCSVADGVDGRGSWMSWLGVAAALWLLRRRRGLRTGATILAALLASAESRAATVVWGGGTGTWGTAANWIGGVAPGASDTASFTGWAPLDRSGWTVTASVAASTANTKDGRWDTRWTTGTNAVSGQWFKIDLGSTQTFSRIVLDDTGDGSDYPPAYDVYVSSDGSTWGSPITSGTGSAPLLTINFSNQSARYIKIQLTAGNTHWWSIREAFVYTTASTADTQLARNGWTVSASNNSSSAPLAIDSALSTRWDTGMNAVSGQWYKVDLGAQTTVDRIEFSSYTDSNDYPPSYTVSVSTDDSTYNSVASGSPAAGFVSATFTAQTARYLKITCTAASSYYFSIHDLNVYGTPRTANVASSISITGLTVGKGAIAQGSGATITLSGAYTQSGGAFTGGNSAISAGSFALSGGTFSSTSNTLTVSGTFSQSGGTFSASTGAVNCSSSGSAATIATGGAYTVGSGAHTFAGGLSVGASSTLTMGTSGGTLAIGSAKTLAIDGTLNATSTGAVIQSAGGAGTYYTFKVGSTGSATPTLNITGLQVKNTDTNGMWINANTSAVTTFSSFNNIAFSAGTGTRLLQIYSANLFLSSSGCTFDSGVATGTTTYNVTLTGNGTADGETRALFGNAACATNKTPCGSYKQDDDAGNGVGGTPATNGAVAQFVTSAVTDTAGTIVGFPSAAIDWSTFAYYSTYAAFHNANGTADRIYVRDAAGAAKYYWEAPAGHAIIGTPRWETVGGVHYLYVATTTGRIYRLVDSTGGLSLAPDSSSPWSGSYFDCGCTITTPLTIDTNNLYWAGTVGGIHKLWTLGKATQNEPMGSPLSTSSSVGAAAPAVWSSGDSYVFLGMPGRISKVDVTTQANVADNTNPGGTTGINGRITISGGTLYAGDDNGYLWALDPGTNFAASSGTYKRWSYHDATNHAACGGVCGIQNLYRDASLGRVYYGDQDGHVYVVDNTGAAVTGFPFRPGSAADAFTTSALYVSGVIIIGTSTGTLYIIDQNSNGSSPALVQTYKFGTTTQISSIAYDNTTRSYLVSTADPAAKDGKIYYISAVSDPTPGYL
jgi:hypothetical protein